jgi:hypothetical protein
VAELPDVLSAAMAHADAAAAAAGVRVELVEDPQRLHAVAELLATVWATAPGQGPLPHHVLRAVAHSGGAVHVAYGSGGPVGAAAAIFGPPEARSAYSLIAAASRSDRGTGFALKQAQRAWALRLGVISPDPREMLPPVPRRTAGRSPRTTRTACGAGSRPTSSRCVEAIRASRRSGASRSAMCSAPPWPPDSSPRA